MQEDVGFGIVLWSATCLVFVLTCLVLVMAGGGLGYVPMAAAGAAAGYLPVRLARTHGRQDTWDRADV